MITEQDTDVHTSTPSTLQATEPVFYLAKIQQVTIFVGAARMATRYIKKTREVQVRVTRCEPPAVIQDMASGRSEVTEATLLVEVNRDDPAAIIEWAKILGATTIELENVTAAQAEQQLNSIASLRAEPSQPGSPTSEPSPQVSYWNPLVEFPSTATVPTDSGWFTYHIKGDLYPRDLWHAIRHVTPRGVAVALNQEIDWSVEGVARGASIELSHKRQDDAAMCRIGDLISEGAFTVTRFSVTDFTFAVVYPRPSVTPEGQQESRTQSQAKKASKSLLSDSEGTDASKSTPDESVKKGKEAGRPRKTLPRVSATSVSGSFLSRVPDFVLADWQQVAPQSKQRRPGRSQLSYGWPLHMLVIQQKRDRVVVPDVLLAQAIWGGRRSMKDWPANWRDDLARLLGGKETPLQCVAECTPECPIHDSSVKEHGHFHAAINRKTFLGALEHFGYQDEQGNWRYDFSKGSDPVSEGEIERLRKSGRITSVYLPLLLFGPTERMKLPSEQQKLLRAITHELTRGYRSSRPDGAKIITGGKKPDGVYAGLKPGQSYVAFNGNASHQRRRLRGYGYRLIGSTGKGWLHKAGYSIPEDGNGPWRVVARFLKDLDVLGGRFGLVAAGWHRNDGAWRSLAEMRSMVNDQQGRRWLKGCVLRIYTAADYLTRWRRHFAEQMGFTSIPGGEGSEAIQQEAKPAIRSASDLDKWMKDVGLTTPELAKILGISERWVRHQRHGTKPWSKKFEKDMELVVQRKSQEGK